MVLQVVFNVATFIFRPGYYTHAVAIIVAFLVAYAFSQGRTTNRERDLHARTILITVRYPPVVR